MDEKTIEKYLKKYKNYNKNFIPDEEEIKPNKKVPKPIKINPVTLSLVLKYNTSRNIIYDNFHKLSFEDQINSLNLYTDKPDKYGITTQYRKIVKSITRKNTDGTLTHTRSYYLTIIMYNTANRIIIQE